METRNLNRGPCNVIMGQRNVIIRPWNVNRGSWNVIRGPCNLIMRSWNLIMDRGI